MVYSKWCSIFLIEWEQNSQSICLQCMQPPMPNLSNCRCKLMIGKLTTLFCDTYEGTQQFLWKKKTKSILILQVILKFFRDLVQQFTEVPLSPVHSKLLQRTIVFCILTGCTLLCVNKHVCGISKNPAEALNLI